MDSRRSHVPLLTILLIATLVRVGFLHRNWSNLDFAPSFLIHAEVARNILHGHWFQINAQYLQRYVNDCYHQGTLIDIQDYPPPAEETLTPLYNEEGGYGVLLALLWKVTGSYRWWYVRVLQVLLDIVMCWLVYRIGRKVFDERVGLVSSFLYACFVPGIELAVRPHRDIWVTFLFIFTVYQLLSLTQGRNPFWRMLVIGIATAMVAWMRSTVLLFVVLMIPILFLTRPRKEALSSAIALLVGFVLVFPGDRRDVPILVHHLVVLPVFPLCAHTEAGVLLDGTLEDVVVCLQRARRDIKDGHHHAAGDIDADAVRNHGIFRRQYAADGKPIAHVRIRHECAGNRDGKRDGGIHLRLRLGIDVRAPGFVGPFVHTTRQFKCKESKVKGVA